MDKGELTVILPCAGEGVRLGLTYPKELFEILPGVKLVDLSIHHIDYFVKMADIPVKIAVVIKRGKESVYHYVKNRLSETKVYPVYFDEMFREWPGSVYSANQYFSNKNVVILPDSYISMSRKNRFKDEDGKCLLGRYLEGLENFKVVFGIKKCTDPDVLKDLGAVKVNRGRVEELIDKPDGDLKNLNGFWCSYGFTKEISSELYGFLIGNVEKSKTDLKDQSFYPPGYFQVENYFDLGTKGSVKKFRELTISL